VGGGMAIGVGKGQSLIMEERPPIGLGNGRGSILGGGHVVDWSTCQTTTQSVVPTIIYTNWMNQIRTLKLLNQKDMCESLNYAITQPNQLIDFLNKIYHQRSSQVTVTIQHEYNTILQQIGQYINVGYRKEPSTITTTIINVPMKIIQWREYVQGLMNHPTVQKTIFQQMLNIINSAGTSEDFIPIIRESTMLMSQVSEAVRTDLYKLQLDIKITTLKSDLSYLLMTYDRMIHQNIKIQLSQLVYMQSQDNYNQMLQQYNSIVVYINSLLSTNALPKPTISELKILFGRLGIQGFCSGLSCGMGARMSSPHTEVATSQTETTDIVSETVYGVDQIYTNDQLIASLSQSSEATFAISDPKYCNVNRFCDMEILEAVCSYGVSECRAIATKIGSGYSCSVKVSTCQKSPSIPQLSEEDVFNLIRAQQYAETITYSSSACHALGQKYISFNDNPFGGLTVQVSYAETTKKCALRINVDESGKDPTAELPLLDLEEVGKGAVTPMSESGESSDKGQEYGIRFKTPDEKSCKQYCNNEADIPTACPGLFECHHNAECWPGTCVCKVTHKCKAEQFTAKNRLGASPPVEKNVFKPANVTIEETIEIPKLLPTINKGNTLIRKKKEQEAKKIGDGNKTKSEGLNEKQDKDKSEDLVGEATRDAIDEYYKTD